MNGDIYREKNIERLSSPERLEDFIKVARPGVWLIMAAITVLIVGAAVWASFGVMEITEPNGEVKTVHPIEFVIN